MSDNKEINLDASVAELEDLKQKLHEAAEHTQDVENGDATPDEERQEPEYILFNKITETTLEILKMPSFVEGFKTISLILGEESAKKVAEMMAVAMTHSAVSAVMFYDEYLNEQLTKQFNRFAEALNNTIAVVNGMEPAMEIYKKRISEIEKQIRINKIQSE